ncbi:unnamed protein product, partial [Coregonus sp. 'balchen']
NVLVMVHLRQILCYGSVRISVPEEQEAGVWVGSIGSTSPPPYQLLTQVYLRVDQGTGDVYTTDHRMDREVLCPDQPQAGECIVPHDAIVGPEAELVKFMVVVEDINDHTPHFDNTEIHLSVSEDVAVGTSFLLDDRAEDRDIGRNGQLQYHLEGAGGFFSVTVEEEEEAAILFLVVRQGLDREKQDLHEMTLVATDCSFTPLSATATLFIKVTDVNDNCPKFTLDSPQKVVITVDTPRDTAVARVRATDLDLGPNAAITYSLSPKISERARELFSLDSHTGLISLRGDLRDRHSDSVSVSDRGEEVVLKVLASGPHCPPADTQVTVSLLPAPYQENGIKIRFIADHQNQTIVLQENQPPTVLALLELPGNTSSVRGSSSLSIEGEVPFSLSLQNGKYLLSTSKPLDYEMKSEYHVSVVMRGSVGETAAQGFPRRVIRVRVVDVNDNAPQFLQSPYLIDIEENNPAGAFLLKVRAQDADSSQNGQVTYKLGQPSHTAAAIFRIDQNTGQLTVSVPLDREQQDVHRLTVVARDNGVPPLESSATVTITVLDQNDNAPVFLTPHFIFFIPENIPPLAQVGKVGVSDLDAGLNGEVEVRVVNSSVGPFVIDNAQGMLRCMADIDREKQDRYELDLLATDNGRPSPLTSVARVTVFIEDVNDNQPQVILPSSNLSCLTISTGTTTGTMVTKIYAIDKDSGLNSEITYTIAAREPPGTYPSSHQHGDSSSSPFQLGARSGNVTLAQRLMGKDLGMHHLFIVVTDGGKPVPLHTTIWVNLLVNDTLEPCHLDIMPRSLPYRPAQTPPETPSETPVCDRHAQLILLLGLGMMVASLCLFLVTVVLYMKQRKRSRGERQQRRQVKENQIPLRIQERYSSGEAL